MLLWLPNNLLILKALTLLGALVCRMPYISRSMVVCKLLSVQVYMAQVLSRPYNFSGLRYVETRPFPSPFQSLASHGRAHSQTHTEFPVGTLLSFIKSIQKKCLAELSLRAEAQGCINTVVYIYR